MGSSYLVTAVLLALLFLGSCDNETPTMCPTTGVGVLEGYLLVLDQGVSAKIAARALEGPSPGRLTHITASDSTGWYRLELPAGLYRLEVDPYGPLSGYSDLYDTIRVLPRVFRFDIKRGRAEVRIGMPDDEEGKRFYLRIAGEDHNSISESAMVQEGLLVFDYPMLVPGAYTMRLQGGNLTDQYYLPGYRNHQDADFLEVGLTEAATYEASFGDSYASISGSISGSWQKTGEIWNPSVEVVTPDSMRIGYKGVSSDGDFTCGFLLPQTVILSSEYRGVIQWMGGDTFKTARVFDLQPGDRITGVTVVESGIQIRLDGPGDLVYHRPSLTIRDESGRNYNPYSNSNNPFSVCNLRAGRYYVQVEGYCEDKIWARQWYGGVESLEGAIPIDLAEGELRQIVMELELGGSIEGNLFRADGSRPYYIEFGLFDAGGEPQCTAWWQQWRRFDEGFFRFQGLENGDHYRGVKTTGDEMWWYPGTREFTEAIPVVIVNHEAVTDVNWVLP